jgi:hypothetical protein
MVTVLFSTTPLSASRNYSVNIPSVNAFVNAFLFSLSFKRRVTEHATFRLMRSKASYQVNREEMNARRKWNSGGEWH